VQQQLSFPVIRQVRLLAVRAGPFLRSPVGSRAVSVAALSVGFIAVALAARWVFSAAFHTFFIEDDFVHFWRNRTPSAAISNVIGALLNPSATGKPLAYLYYFADQAISGADPALYHDVLFVTHALNGVLLAVLLRLLYGHLLLPALAATLFVLYPTNATTLSWSVLIPDVVGAALALSGLIAAALWLNHPTIGRLVTAWLFCLGAALSKEAYLPVPLVAAILMLGGPVIAPRLATGTVAPLRQRLIAGAPLLAISVVLGIRILAFGTPDLRGYPVDYSLPRLASNLVLYLGYWTQGLTFAPSPSAERMAPLILALGVAAVGLLALGRATIHLAFWLTMFPVMLLPVLFLTEHREPYYIYFAQIGLVVPTAFLVSKAVSAARLISLQPGGRAALIGALCIIVGVLVIGARLVATDLATDHWVSKRASVIEPWWERLRAQLPHPPSTANLVFLGSTNWFDAGHEFYSTHGGTGMNFLYQEPSLETTWPIEVDGQFSVVPISAARHYEVFVTNFWQHEGFVRYLTISEGEISTHQGVADVLSNGGTRSIAGRSEEMLLLGALLESPHSGIGVHLMCQSVSVDSFRLEAGPRVEDRVLAVALWQVPPRCGSRLTLRVESPELARWFVLARR